MNEMSQRKKKSEMSLGRLPRRWLHPRESGPVIGQGPGSVITCPTLLG